MMTLVWTFALIMAASIVIGWAAEITGVYLSAGIALAILAWLQTAPEFAVEASIAWHRNSDLVLANLSGSLRLLMGLGWPMIVFIHWFSHHRRKNKQSGPLLPAIQLPIEFAVECVSLIIPVLYFLIIWLKGTWTAFDGIILCSLYGFYFWLLMRQRKAGLAQDHEEQEDLPYVAKKVSQLPRFLRILSLFAMFFFGAAILIGVTHPFIHALQVTAGTLGISEYVFVQWIAPIASEFPEKITAFNWARKASKVPMAIVNMLSSITSQWTLMAGLVPIIFSISAGSLEGIHLTAFQRTELMLTILQTALAVTFLADFKLNALEAIGLFALWLVQFIIPHTRSALIPIYSFWILIELARLLLNPQELRAWKTLGKIFFLRKN